MKYFVKRRMKHYSRTLSYTAGILPMLAKYTVKKLADLFLC